MNALITMWALSTASAFTEPAAGARLEVGIGLGLADAPVQPAFGGYVHVGWFRGQFDDAFSLGRYWELGLTGRLDTRLEGARIAPMVELRRGTDLVVASVSPFVAGGPLVVVGGAPAVGYTARAGLNATYRMHRFRGVVLRLEAGADVVGGAPSFAGGVLVGVSLGRPFRAIDD